MSQHHIGRTLDFQNLQKSGKDYCSNSIYTTKYSVLTFLPKFLFEQFHRYANIFFLFISLIQQIPGISPTGRFTTLIPLAFILLVSAVKEIIEDIRRYRTDKEVNYKKVEVIHDGHWKTIFWYEILVGDVVKVDRNTAFPADLLLVASSETDGSCFMETANLDGETNLKMRQALPVTSHLTDVNDFKNFKGSIEYESPNPQFYHFDGILTPAGANSYPLGPNQILLRGAVLRNTQHIYGIVIYSGRDTKIMNNYAAPQLKRSTLDKTVNLQILIMFVLFISLCLLSTIASEIWRIQHSNVSYLNDQGTVQQSFGQNFLTYVILFNNLIPISLQVTMELVRFVQAYFVNMDIDMYYEKTDTPATARTSNLNEDLGQVKYIFSDKTGTLTQNFMRFKKFSVSGEIFSVDNDPVEIRQRIRNETEHSGELRHFLTVMALCHTVIPENKDNKIEYSAMSPDEKALVQGAAYYGFIFTHRTKTHMVIEALGETKLYEVLNVIEFSSSRKRMSVIVRTPSGKIKLLCKGANSVISKRMHKTRREYEEITSQHLMEFAKDGLRTLCYSERILSESTYEKWQKGYKTANLSLIDRETKVEEAAENIEKNLILLGATGIEDKLQDEVPETIVALKRAEIHIWVLTGDMMETAINIGYSCNLILPESNLVLITETDFGNTLQKITSTQLDLKKSHENHKESALIVSGDALKYALSLDLKRDFFNLCVMCNAVVCCRLTPMQKAEVVAMVKSFTKSVTLAIGDGANDVSMIRTAHIGVGISGVEGMQAVGASDFAIAQFRYLRKLLFVHGSWNYVRISKVILYSFYKNVLLYSVQLWYAFFSGWSGQIMFEMWSMSFYNLIFTAVPPLVLGMFDRTCSAGTLLKFPNLYKYNHAGDLFNTSKFWIWIFTAAYHSIMLFSFSYFVAESEVLWSKGYVAQYPTVGNILYASLMICVCVKAALITEIWTWIHHVGFWGSAITWYLFIVVYSHVWPTLHVGYHMVWQDRMLFSTPILWLSVIFIPTVTLLPDISYKIIRRTACKTEAEETCENEKRVTKILVHQSGSTSAPQPRKSNII